ncbi:MAG TPA: polysaccharide biosynthesis/export family protein [Vicinamibacterales bacterium]|nr:polysaccharide biosynthesis/export family protein [Vicinamibacterales bacterium]
MTILTRLSSLGLLLTIVSPCQAGQQQRTGTTTAFPAESGKGQPAGETTTRPKPAVTDDRNVPRDYVIGPSDVIEIAVWNNDAVSRTVPVRPDGKISLQLVNDVQAAGMTPMQLRDALTKALTAYVQNPEVSVIVREVHSFKVSVMGEVKEPGRYDLTGRVTVLDVLAMAKGLTQYADKNKIAILRREQSGATRSIPVDYQRLVSNDSINGRDNFLVQPDDIVVVR